MYPIHRYRNLEAYSYTVERIDTKFSIKLRNAYQKLPLYKGPSNFSIDIKNIIKLDLSYCKLNNLPDELGNLPIKILDVSHNNLSIVPKCIIETMCLIEKLDLSFNHINKFENEPVCSCRLRILDLSYNEFVNIPMWIQTVSTINLREFYYNGCNIGDTNNAEYKKVASYSLEKLVFFDSRCKSKNVDFIKSIRTLKCLDLSNHRSYYDTISPIEDLFDKPDWMDTLENLSLVKLQISFLPESILILTSLKELYLSENDLYYLPESFGELKTLMILDLSHNYLWCLPKTFINLTNLHVLKLNNNNLSKIEEIYKLKKLVGLDLYHNELNSFNNNFYVEYLDLEQNSFDTNILNDYAMKKDLYRVYYGLLDRLNGPFIEENNEVEVDRSSFTSNEENESDVQCFEVSIDNESWNEDKKKSHPDISTSDDEWDGVVKYPSVRKKPIVKFDPECSKLYEDCSENDF